MYVVLFWRRSGDSFWARSKSMNEIGVVVKESASRVRPMIFMRWPRISRYSPGAKAP